VVRVLLDDETIRRALLQQIVSKADAALPPEVRANVSLAELTTAANQVLDDPRVRTSIEQALVDSHRYVIGDLDREPVLDTSAVDAVVRERLALIRPDVAALLPAQQPIVLQLPDTGLSAIHRVRDLVTSLTPLLAVTALCAAAAGLLVSPNRPSVLRRIGFWAVSMGAVWIVLRFALPALVEALFGDRGAVLAALSEAVAGGMAVPGTLMFLAGLATLALATVVGTVERSLAAAAHNGRSTDRPDRSSRLQARRQRTADAASARHARTGTQAPPAASVASTGADRAAAPTGPGPRTANAANVVTAAPVAYGYPRAKSPAQVPLPGVGGAGHLGSVPMAGPHPGAPAAPPLAPGAARIGSRNPTRPAASSAPPVMPAPPVPVPTPEPAGRPAGPLAEASAVTMPSAAVVPGATPGIAIPLPRRDPQDRRDPARSPDGPVPLADGAVLAQTAPDGGPAGSGPPHGGDGGDGGSGNRSARPAPNDWLGGFSMSPQEHARIADPAPPPPRWIEGVGYVYDYAPTESARWIDGLGYVLDED
jgi:hypothetical protein